MKQIEIRWGDLGPPTKPGTYRYGSVMVDVTPGDIKLANGKNDAVFTAIHPDFYSEETPYLLVGVALPSKRPLETYLPNRPSTDLQHEALAQPIEYGEPALIANRDLTID